MNDVEQAKHNAQVWGGGGFVASYDRHELVPAEVLLLVRYRESFTGRVLEVGIGAGRVLGYLVALGGEVHGIDISADMVDHCRARWPTARLEVGDLASLQSIVSGRFDAILLADNLLDVFADAQRRQVLTMLRALLAPAGVLVFSTHNLARRDATTLAVAIRERLNEIASLPPRTTLGAIRRLPRRYANRRRLEPRAYRAADHAVLNDGAHDYGLLHYYISHPDQVRQLAALDFVTLEVLELSGEPVPSGAAGQGTSLYYVAADRRRRGSPD